MQGVYNALLAFAALAALLAPAASSRRDFRCRGWNETMAAVHEQSFLRCLDTKPPAQDQLLLNGSQPLSLVAQSLMQDKPLHFCECTLHLHNAALCGHSSAAAVLEQFEPWCFMLAACKGMAQALLTSAFVCHSEGMAGDNESALCADYGENSCADAVHGLFEATHSAHGWENISDLLRDLHVPLTVPSLIPANTTDANGAAELITAADRRASGGDGATRRLRFPAWLTRESPTASPFGQLSGCMASVRVVEEQLHLPVSLSALSGNGSFTEYAQLFRHKCGFDYYQWMIAQVQIGESDGESAAAPR
mmetsp:Transcript_36627/g.85555  ORF Transcript_36627/g.85555 Transcript_36627/m.85555 type:complete len:307 (-) Transcript_36627:917-1837(-)